MPSLPIAPPAKAAPNAAHPPGARAAGPPPPSGPGDFAALLDQTSARTAPAEGPKTRPAAPDASRRRDGRVDRGRDEEAHAAKEARVARPADPPPPADAAAT